MRYSMRNRFAAGGLALAALVSCCGSIWLVSEREELAVSLLPFALSLRLLELKLLALPHDDALRMRLARKCSEAGQVEEARELVLRARRNPTFLGPALELLVDLDYARWSAMPADDHVQRERMLSELHATLDDVAAQSKQPELLLRAAALYYEISQPAQAAAILDQLARAAQPPEAARFEAAEAAWLEAGLPLAAANLRAFQARLGGVDGALHARLALERARLADDPEALLLLLRQMRALYPHDRALARLALSLAEVGDVRRASGLALELTRTMPKVPLYHREAARLAEASGRSLCALDQYMWLWRHERRAEDKRQALRLARKNWDLQLLRELLDGPRPSWQRSVSSERPRRGCRAAERRSGDRASRDRTRARRRRTRASNVCEGGAQDSQQWGWEERFRVYEALGDTLGVRGLLTRIVRSPEGNSMFWWRRKLALERRLDDPTAALHTLARMLERFPDRGVRDELAELQLATADASAALVTLLAAPQAQRDASLLRRICAVAAAVGDITSERQAYSELVRLPESSLGDYQRLLALAPDTQSAARIAAEAAVRFQSFYMFDLALQLFRRQHDEPAELALIEQVELLDGIAQHAEYWQVRIGLQQARAARAASQRNYGAAKVALENADDLLRYAAKHAPDKEQYALLWGEQHSQALTVGIASGDTALALRAYLATRASLNARERVYLLIKLGQTGEALEEAKRELDREPLRDSDPAALPTDALSPSRGRATDLQFQGNALSMAGLQVLSSSARVDYAEIEGGLRINIAYTQYQPMAVDPMLPEPIHDMTGALRGRIGRFGLELGSNVRNSDQVRPFGTLSVQLAGDEQRGASLQLQGNVVNTDTARMRVFGSTDALAVKASVGLGKHFWASGRGAGEMYYTRAERQYLGAGATVELALGSDHELPAKLGRAGGRVFARGTPRFPKRTELDIAPELWLPATSIWSGLGVNLSRGQLDAPLLFERQVSYALDASLGWLWPTSSIGWSVTGQLGVSCFGADNLWLGVTAGNVLGTSGLAGTVGYVVSFAE